MGVVYKARQRSLGRTVALKTILDGRLGSEAAVQRFRREARAAAGLDHPNIVPIYEVGQCDGRHYFTMALVDGSSLLALVKKDGPPALPAAVAIVLAVAEAVDYAHTQGIIHRDLKPDNILMDRQGRPRVTDFGLARSLQEEGGPTASGDVLGTPNYMAPEQGMGKSELIGPAADIYALGGILYFLLTGRAPFRGASSLEVLYQVLEQPPVPPRQLNARVPEGLQAVCLKCLEKDPARRYATASELARALRPWAPPAPAGTFLEDTPAVPASPSARLAALPSTIQGGSGCQPDPAQTMPVSPAPARQRLGWLLGGLAAAGLLAVGGVVATGWQGARLPTGPGGIPHRPAVPVSEAHSSLEEPASQAEPADGTVGRALIPTSLHHDFELKVEMLGSQPGRADLLGLVEGQKVAFRVEVDRAAYVGIWTVLSDRTIQQVFPSKYESNHRLEPGKPQIVPGNPKYTITATPGTGTEWVWAVASTRRWDSLQGEGAGPYLIFKTEQERQRWQRHVRGIRRGLKLEPTPGQEEAAVAEQDRAAVAEALLSYRVAPSGQPDGR
jgi:tRNA A-37 threonylcarbamoyl transferase component Bud32